MNRHLYVLVTSERPDAYLNSVAHCILHEGVRTVEFIHVRGFGEQSSTQSSEGKSAKILRRVHTLLEDLVTFGEYRHFEGEESGTKVDLKKIYPPDRLAAIKNLYSACLRPEIQLTNKDIDYSGLRGLVSHIADKVPSAIVDVSSVKKGFIGDLVAASVVEGLQSLYTFDLLKRADYDHPWTMLFHDLNPNGSQKPQYKYVNLLDTQVFRECSRSLLVRKPSLYISLVLGFILLMATLAAYLIYGESNWFVQFTFIMSAIASLLSLVHGLFPTSR